jgi:hypothetical protein
MDDLSRKEELEEAYLALGRLIYEYMTHNQIDKTKLINKGLIYALRDTTLEYLKGNMDLILTNLINRDRDLK